MRWARVRGLPIHHVPGGKQRSVYALRSELNDWLLREADYANAAAHIESDVNLQNAQPLPTPIRGKRYWVGIAIGLALAAASLSAMTLIQPKIWGDSAQPQVALPSDPGHAQTYLAARDAWSRRTPESLKQAITLYNKLIQLVPNYAPAHSGLAEAWLALAEYGAVNTALAHRAARQSATIALALNPTLGDGHRVLAYLSYWSDDNPTESIRQFQLAIKYDQRDLYHTFPKWHAV